MAADAESALADATGESLLEGDAREALTVRAVALGLCAVVALDLIAIYVRYIYRASLMTYSHIPMSMLIAFTLLIMIGSVLPAPMSATYPCTFTPAGHVSVQGGGAALSIVYTFGIVCG